MMVELILTYALMTNAPLYINEQGPPYRDSGMKLHIHAPLPHDFYLHIAPYVWKSRDMDTVGNGGAILRMGWENEHFGVALMHNSEHNFDRFSRGGNINLNMVEARWKLK